MKNIIGIMIGLLGLIIFIALGKEFWYNISNFGLFCYFILLGILLWSSIKLYKYDIIWLGRYVFIIFSCLFGFVLFFLTIPYFDSGFWFMLPVAILFITFVTILNIFYPKTAEDGLIENQDIDEDEESGKEENKDEEENFEEDYAEGEDLDSKYANILGLKGKVTFTEIKNSYKNKMKEYHPDKVDNMGEKLKDLAEKESKMINEAYEYFKKKNR